ncbi:MAG: hypothetical protein K0S45_3232 [Nitrospira sp.]|jgi:hypothetical protein|nr:hypothetical protein [Nitrospira sp.]
MDDNNEVEIAVLQYMQQHVVCPMEELFRSLPGFTLNQKFLTVHRLSREGKVHLRFQNRCEYVIVPPAVRRESLYGASGRRLGDRF